MNVICTTATLTVRKRNSDMEVMTRNEHDTIRE